MNKWVLGARPRTLPAAITPVIVAVAIAYPTLDLLNALLALIVGLSLDRKSTRLNSSHVKRSRMPSSA